MYSEEGGFHSEPSEHSHHYNYGHEQWLAFQSTRKRHNENICHQTNDLLLRLDKLINDAPNSQGPETTGEHVKLQMREHEKSVVEWISDDIVELCPFCRKSFTLSRRRHHCRLCGAVMCHNCSKFLDYEYACKLIRPTNLQEQQDGDPTRQSASNEQLNKLNANSSSNSQSSPTRANSKSIAKSLLSPFRSSSSRLQYNLKQGGDSRPSLLSNAFGHLRSQNRRGSQTSLLTFINSSTNSSSSHHDHQSSKVRLCEDCMGLLAKRLKLIEDHYYHPLFCDFYEKLRSRITQADRLLETYDGICDSLKLGEEEYTIQYAQELRSKLNHLKDNIAHMTKNIKSFSTSNEKEDQLLTALTQSVCFWVKKNMTALSTYPNVEEYERLKSLRRQQIEDQLLMNSSSVIHGHESTINLGGAIPNNRGEGSFFKRRGIPRLGRLGAMKRSSTHDSFGQTNSAWMPDHSNLCSPIDTEEVNPLLLQIRNIDEYIKQARQASRYDEVSTLESNKRDLEIEFLIQQGENSMQLDNTTASSQIALNNDDDDDDFIETECNRDDRKEAKFTDDFGGETESIDESNPFYEDIVQDKERGSSNP